MKKLFSVLLVFALVLILFVHPAYAEEVQTAAPAPAVDLTGIIVSALELVLSFLFVWLAKAVVPPVKKWLETRTNAQQRELLNKMTKQLVLAAEQTIGARKGSEKYRYVLDGLRKRGFDVDEDAIEAAVHEMNYGLLGMVDDITGDYEETEKQNE